MRILVAALMLLVPAAVHAHALGAEATLDSGQVHVCAYFDDDTPARSAKVTVTDREKQLITEGLTDSEGRWSFPAPPPGAYRITIDAGDGHRTTVNLSIPEQPAPAAVVSEGPSRSEFTKPRWIGLGVGVLLIAAMAIGSRFYLKRQNAG